MFWDKKPEKRGWDASLGESITFADWRRITEMSDKTMHSMFTMQRETNRMRWDFLQEQINAIRQGGEDARRAEDCGDAYRQILRTIDNITTLLPDDCRWSAAFRDDYETATRWLCARIGPAKS